MEGQPLQTLSRMPLMDSGDLALLREFTHGKTLEDYESNSMLRSAVERQFEVIGEAVVHLARTDQPVADRII